MVLTDMLLDQVGFFRIGVYQGLILGADGLTMVYLNGVSHNNLFGIWNDLFNYGWKALSV